NPNINTDVGLWVEVFAPGLPAGGAYAAPGQEMGSMAYPPSDLGPMMDPGYRQAVPEGPPPEGLTAAAPAVENAINSITMLCRGVNLDHISPTANQDLAYTLADQIKKSGYFAEGTTLGAT